MIAFHGIRNCDTCRKARKWLDARGVEYCFHDLQREDLDRAMIDHWMDVVGEALLINRRGRTWRQLSFEQQTGLDSAALRQLLLEQPTLMKRPIVAWDDSRVTVGFDPDVWESRIR